MPTTLRNTDILFNDGTTQTTAATAGGLVTTTNVLNATAGASLGAVGTYAYLHDLTAQSVAPGNTIAASNLRYSGGSGGSNPNYIDSPVPSGTWRTMGVSGASNGSFSATVDRRSTLWLRIS
jgi:hypothetical protein